MKNYLQSKKENRKFKTRKIFLNVDNFKRVIKRIYKNINVKRTANIDKFKTRFEYASMLK